MKINVLCIGLFCAVGIAVADCPLDHYLIGVNADGIDGTADDNQLFVDCSQIYRHSDPDNSGGATWQYWHYPLYYNERYNRYQIGEPGFDVIADGSARQLSGTAGVDYQIWIECTAIRTGLSARNIDYGIVLDSTGESFCHSSLSDTHIHLSYRVASPLSDGPYWITYRIYDAFGAYDASDEFTLVFIEDPATGDVVVDGTVDLSDLERWLDYWLREDGGYGNDFYYRCDINRNGWVDLGDFAMLAVNWLTAVSY
jgi:hypothetical protein